jgi:hypothetical protein
MCSIQKRIQKLILTFMTRLSGQYSLCYDSLNALLEPSIPVEDRAAQPSTHQKETLKSQEAVQIKSYDSGTH